MTTTADLYLRLSDFRRDDADSFPQRERALRAKAAELGWTVREPIVIENDRDADGRRRPASAWKRQRVIGPDGQPRMRDDGRPMYRVLRPGFRSILDHMGSGAVTAILAEDLDRACRDPRDLEDLIDAVRDCRGHARSLSGSLMLSDGGTSDQLAMARVMVAMGSKASADTARRVADGRERTAGLGSYGGGTRPFGYRPDPDAPKYHKRLIIVESEAAWIRKAADAVLAEGDDCKSLRFMARELRDAGVPTVTGAKWTAPILRSVLLKPAVCGRVVNTRTGTRTEGAWPAILEPEVWEAVVAKLTDPSRRTSPGTTPRWMGSGIYRCGACAKLTPPESTTLTVTGGRTPAYWCRAHPHLKRVAVPVDALVGRYVTAFLERADNRDLLRPPVRTGVDAVGLRKEQRRLETIGKRQAQMHAVGEISDAEMRAGSQVRKDRLLAIAAQLASTTKPDPLKEFRGHARAVWDGLSLARKRDVLRLLAEVTLLPAVRNGPVFDPASVQVRWLSAGLDTDAPTG